MSQALIDATKEWLEHVMPNPWPFKRRQVLRVPTNSVTLAGLDAISVGSNRQKQGNLVSEYIRNSRKAEHEHQSSKPESGLVTTDTVASHRRIT